MTEKSSLLIHKIEITNCGGFIGHHEIELSTKKEQNFTIILGESGIGKSTTFQLIFWCLFGKHFNPKDSRKMTDQGIINSELLKHLEVGKNVVGSIVLHIHDQNGEKYVLTRALKATKHRNETGKKEDQLNNSRINSGIQTEISCKMVMPDKDGGMITEKEESLINNELRPLLPQSLSDFFLFDGERLMDFANPTDAAALIQAGIEKISGLPIVETMLDSMATTSKEIMKHAGSKDIDSKGMTNALEQSIEERDDLNEEIKKLKEEEQGNALLHNELREQMVKSKAGKDIQTKIDREEKTLSRLKKDKKKHDSVVKEFLFRKIPELLIRETLLKAQDSFARLEELDQIPPSISSEGIDKIRNNLKCLCGTEFKENDETWDRLGKVKERIVDSNMSRDVMQGVFLISGIVDESVPDKVKVNYDELDETTLDLSREIKTQTAEVNQLHEERSKLPRDGGINYDELSQQSDDLWKKNGILQGRLIEMNRELEGLEQSITELNKKLKTRLEVEGKHEMELAKIDILKAITSFAKKRKNEIIDNLRGITEKATDEYFMNSAPQKDTFGGVEISSKYDITAVDKDGESCSLSAGQSHVLGLSYVAGCRQITNTHTFLFIDSPLHNISGNFRNEVAIVLAKHLPPGVQVTLFVTESEYKHGDPKGAAPVREILKPTGKIWREYEIGECKTDDGESTRCFKVLK